MESKFDTPLELAFIKEAVNQMNFDALDFYHRSQHNDKLPFKRFDFREFMWDKEMPDEINNDDMSSIEDKLWGEFNIQLDCENECLKEEFDFEVTQDMNQYRIMPILPIKELLEGFEELEENLKYCEDQEEVNDTISEMKDSLEELQSCDKQYEEFEKWLENFKEICKEIIDEMIIVFRVNEDYIIDEYKYNIVREDEYEDYYKEAGWTKWSKEVEDFMNEEIIMCEEENIIETMNKDCKKEIEHVKKDKKMLAKNSMTY